MTNRREPRIRWEDSKDTERRRHARYDASTSIEYRMADKDGELCRGRLLNVNDSGFCAILYKPISEGQEIRIEKGHQPFPCKRAMVRWAKGFQLDVYIVGFECKAKVVLPSSQRSKWQLQ